MKTSRRSATDKLQRAGVRRAGTGIQGFDDLTAGGLPDGRVTVVLGDAGSGKTIFGVQTLVAGARDAGEPGILVTFEESSKQIAQNMAGFSWGQSPAYERLGVLDAQLSQAVVQGGDFDLLGLLSMLGAKVEKLRAKRVVLDGLDVLLSNLSDPLQARREVFRLREWLQQAGITAIITAKTEPNDVRPVQHYEYMQFMADCVVTLQHRVVAGTALRFLRVAKYRGGAHSANEVPFSFGRDGIEVATNVTKALRHRVSSERVSTGVERLDAMLEGGYFRGSSTLISGVPGTAKTTLGAAFASAACQRGERTLFISFDESPEQIVRNVASVGIQLAPHVKTGLLQIHSLRSRFAGPEAHVSQIRALLREHRARNLIIDPISALGQSGAANVGEEAAIQVLDLAKSQGVTSVSSSLLGDKAAFVEDTPIGISTIADTWMHLTYVNQGGERNRALTIIKSRGTAHSNQVRELVLSRNGVTLADVYAVGGEVLMGTLRWQRENESRRTRELAARDASMREREAELALAETEARARVIAGERAIREATLERIKVSQVEELDRSSAQTKELQRRRGIDQQRKVASKKNLRRSS